MSGALSYINTTSRKGRNGKLKLFSLACLSECKPLKYFKKFYPLILGLYVSTPLYVIKSNLENEEELSGNDGNPIFCEANCLTQICGFNVPLFFSLLNSPKKTQQIKVGKEGKIFMIGIRPYIIIDLLQKEVNIRKKIDCVIEGGLHEG